MIAGPTYTRQTSRAAYDAIERSGLLSQRRLEVYQALFHHGPLTGKELYRMMKRVKNNPDLHDTFQQRLSELVQMGLARELGTKICSVTGHNVILWDVTDQISPRLLQKADAETKTQKIVRLERELAQERGKRCLFCR